VYGGFLSPGCSATFSGARRKNNSLPPGVAAMPAMTTENTFEAIDYSPLRTLTHLGSIVWQRKALVLLGLAVALVLGGLLYSQTPPVYQSSAQVLVVKKRPDVVMPNPADQRAAYVEDYLATHVILI